MFHFIRHRRRPLARTQVELQRLWERRVRRPVDVEPCLVVLLIAPDGQTTRTAQVLTDINGPLDPDEHEQFGRWVTYLLEGTRGWRVALLLCRSGPDRPLDDDLIWAASLRHAVRSAEAGCDVIHLRANGRVLPLPLDDLPAEAIGF